MIDKEKVLTGLGCCSMNGSGCKRCPYNKECDVMPDYGNAHLCSDALELLKKGAERITFLETALDFATVMAKGVKQDDRT